MNRRFVLGVSLGLALLPFLAGCNGVTHESFEPVRYRLTAMVETPEGLRSGYSVIEVAWGMSRMSGPFGGSGYTIKGNAAAVDLPSGQTLFVLLRSADDADWAAWVINDIPVPGQNQSPAGDRAAQIASQKQRLDFIRANRAIHYLWGSDVPKDRGKYLPYFVRFRDIADPKSMEELKPDDLEKSFGKGYALKSLTIQITDEPVTTGIEKRLPKPPFSRTYVYEGEESETLGLHKGKMVSDVVETEAFSRGI